MSWTYTDWHKAMRRERHLQQLRWLAFLSAITGAKMREPAKVRPGQGVEADAVIVDEIQDWMAG